jgi:hypothetical protein
MATGTGVRVIATAVTTMDTISAIKFIMAMATTVTATTGHRGRATITTAITVTLIGEAWRRNLAQRNRDKR